MKQLGIINLSEFTYNKLYRWAAATICPRPGLQRKRAAAALSRIGGAGPDQPIRAIQPAGRTPLADRMYVTNVRQTARSKTSDSIIA